MNDTVVKPLSRTDGHCQVLSDHVVLEWVTYRDISYLITCENYVYPITGSTMVFRAGERFNLNRKENIGLDKTK